jgi:predicted kinase
VEAVIFIGLQAAGKSSFYKERFFDTHVRINLDMLKTRHRETLLLQACLAMKQPFVVDNTNPTIAARQRYIDLAAAARFRVHGYYFQVSLEECLRRNEQRDPAARVPVRGIVSTYRKLQPPSRAEGFDRLATVSIDESGRLVVAEWPDEG